MLNFTQLGKDFLTLTLQFIYNIYDFVLLSK